MSTPPENPKIYHIVHWDRLSSIAEEGLLSDATMQGRSGAGTTIGMSRIKERRLNQLTMASHPGLHVGDCVPFYFCPRSVMLYVISTRNHPDLPFKDGQEPIVHLEADLHGAVSWANANGCRWAFTTTNAGANYFEDYADLTQLSQIDWEAVLTYRWGGPGVDSTVKEGKQAEFLVEGSFPWSLVTRVGVHSNTVRARVHQILATASHVPDVQVLREWYY